MADAHNTDLYYLGKGILSFNRLVGGSPVGYIDLGNASAFSITPAIEKLEHFSSREGIKKKDKTVITSAGLTAKFTLDEYDRDNLAMALLGTHTGGVINLLSDPTIEGALRFVGSNTVGPNFQVDLWKVAIQPTAEVGLINEAWGEITFEAEVESDIENNPTQEYGIITEINMS